MAVKTKRAKAKPGDRITCWFRAQGWKPFAFQQETWSAHLQGRSGLVHSPTGTGKTYAVWLGPLLDWMQLNTAGKAAGASQPVTENQPVKRARDSTEPLQVLWITPLRALANDTVESMLKPICDLGLPWSVELRTGDTASSLRAKQRERFPTALVTTPESLSLLLSYPDTQEKMKTLRCVVVDEWHDLIGTKRGVQTELCLARLRTWTPGLRVWGLSATLGNLEQAQEVLLGTKKDGVLISGDLKKEVRVKTLLPRRADRFPWAGHTGLNLLPEVIHHLEKAKTTLLFANTRSQTEIWFRALCDAKPEWINDLAIHHGSVDRDTRAQVEERLRRGDIRCVVCTASLDLGVDFSPVEQVIQVGAPKGVARMLQRAGRSGHQPGMPSTILCVPAHALELVEFAAVREAIAARQLEARIPLDRPLDVLIQHMVTVALGGGFIEREFFEEVRTSHAYRALSELEWKWCMDFITQGGKTLRAYPQFSKVVERDGRYVVEDRFIAGLHRMSVGTITSDSAVSVRVVRGAHLGSVEESFIARIKPGQTFTFAGNSLELVRVRDMTAWVRRAKKSTGAIPQWMGGKMPLSSQLAAVVRRKLGEALRGKYDGREMEKARPVLELQHAWSRVPDQHELLIERVTLRDGTHHFIFPFAGRLAHEGLSALLAHRVSQIVPSSISVVVNDYGFGLLCGSPLELNTAQWRAVLSPENLVEDLLACLNSTELARRQFREIARVAGLIFQGYPGAAKPMRQLQASSGLFYEVFLKYDPENLLLNQARREVLERQLEVNRLKTTLQELQSFELVPVELKRLTPLSFPLWASFTQASVSSERWFDRVQRMAESLEREAEGGK